MATPIVIDRPVHLESPNRLKLILIVLVCVVICAILATFLWSSIIPADKAPGAAQPIEAKR